MGARTRGGSEDPSFVRRGSDCPEAPVVSVCILVLTDPGMALGCLESLHRSGCGVEAETVVVANGVPPGARAPLEAREDIVLVRSGTNLGFAGGNNLAGGVARGRYLLFLNDDSTIEPGCIDRLVATAERHAGVGAVGARILAADGSLQEAGSVLWDDGHATHVGRGLSGGTWAFSYVRDVDYVSANGLLVRRDAWEEVGGFDERYYPAYFEDADLCMAIRRRGHRVLYEPRARLRHLESQSTSPRYRNFLMSRNRRRFIAKWADELALFYRRPGRADSQAIERSINRARGMPPRVLVTTSAGAGGPEVATAPLVEALATTGWAVTVAAPAGVGEGDRPEPVAADTLVDLGVDVRRQDVAGVLADVGAEFEAIVASEPPTGRSAQVLRTDGTPVPWITPTVDGGRFGIDRTLAAVVEAARRLPLPSPLIG